MCLKSERRTGRLDRALQAVRTTFCRLRVYVVAFLSMHVTTVLAAAVLLSTASVPRQAPGPPNPGRGSYSSADQAAPLPGAEAKPVLSPSASTLR